MTEAVDFSNDPRVSVQAGQEGRGGVGTGHPKTRNLLVLGSVLAVTQGCKGS